MINQLRTWGGSWPGMFTGMALAVLAVLWVMRQATLPSPEILRSPIWLLLILLLATQYMLTSGLFLLVTRRYPLFAPISFRRMLCLTAASTLLNYVPMIRAGLWGRAVFLRHHHGLAYRDSLYSLGWIVGLSLWCTLLVVVTAAAIWALGTSHEQVGWWILGLLTLLSCIAAPWLLRCTGCTVAYHAWTWPVLRMLELMAAAARLWLILHLLGTPCGLLEVMVAVSIASLVRLTGLTPNGLGLSDWVLALVLSLIDPATLAQTTAAALLDRMLEMLFSLPAGLGGLSVLGWAHRSRSINQASAPGAPPAPPHPRDP